MAATLVLLADFTVSGTVTDGSHALSDAVVWIENGTKPKPSKATVDQKNKRFSPHISVVPVGSKISFPNHDDVFHNVFAEFRAKKFDLGMYPRGQSKSVTFDKSGVVSVLCSVHSEMSAYIIVVDTPYFGKTDSKGRFKFAVGKGEGVLHVWHESGKSLERKIDVEGSQTLELVATKH
ncbi:MAG TPA: hypothetical protein VNI20_12055 [Fimbriimonadaceae bacterium]|nr:hypothetical protein [Fimbriimonadaceae bacterium]